ncbi:hypothetical protein PENSPDRAFT_750661 [Peniophora sp. CONT]|nr:hypothetical protein PENSPDRAFT_750661 [Peniophora sp. CONT]
MSYHPDSVHISPNETIMFSLPFMQPTNVSQIQTGWLTPCSPRPLPKPIETFTPLRNESPSLSSFPSYHNIELAPSARCAATSTYITTAPSYAHMSFWPVEVQMDANSPRVAEDSIVPTTVDPRELDSSSSALGGAGPSCIICRGKKKKCSRERDGCKLCIEQGVECLYPGSSNRGGRSDLALKYGRDPEAHIKNPREKELTRRIRLARKHEPAKLRVPKTPRCKRDIPAASNNARTSRRTRSNKI